MEQQLIYPLGVQSFEEMRTDGYVYIDKTDIVYRMTRLGMKFVFLNRPRRFGKSLLVSTLQCYFEGRRELFKGLAIDSLEKEWKRHPVLHFDLSASKYKEARELRLELDNQLSSYEILYGRDCYDVTPSQRLKGLIKHAREQYGEKVVLLIDEYDSPMLDVLHQPQQLADMRSELQAFYSPLKMCSSMLRYVFITGITKFSQLSIFSELNSLFNISMDHDYASICGITEEELTGTLRPGIEKLAECRKEELFDTLQTLKNMYDGYHFTWPSPDIYNPYSLFNALSRKEIDAFWFGTGTPSYLIRLMNRFKVLPRDYDRLEVKKSSFDKSTETLTSPVPLLYQSGYVTIKGYDKDIALYKLGIPNKEVRLGLMENLLPEYVGDRNDDGLTMVALLSRDIKNNQMDSALRRVQQFLKTVPYTSNASSEGHFQQMLYVIFSLLGYDVDVEVHTPVGRVDIVIRTDTHLYLLELKLNKDAATAMHQIDLKDYASRFALAGLPVTKVGVNFDSATRTISDWQIHPEQ